jgi:hypothetical protein
VGRTLAEQEQNGRLREALDPGPDVIFTGGDPASDAGVTAMSPHTCKRHMYRASIPVSVPVTLG